ncbi:MAG: hypothetical protein U9O24_04560 [Campylobacterota bacterium]|nr:hypothetical protein [Campylobacterota bacterium]
MKKSRRSFLKKSLYSAPVLVALGQFIQPVSIRADGTGGPSGPPGGFFSIFKSTSSNKRVRPTRESKKTKE